MATCGRPLSGSGDEKCRIGGGHPQGRLNICAVCADSKFGKASRALRIPWISFFPVGPRKKRYKPQTPLSGFPQGILDKRRVRPPEVYSCRIMDDC